MTFKPYREESRTNWGRDVPDNQSLSRDDLQFGAMLRIADACERMAEDHDKLIRERDRYQRWYESERQSNDRLRNSNAALRGVITRMKNKAIAKAKGEAP